MSCDASVAASFDFDALTNDIKHVVYSHVTSTTDMIRLMAAFRVDEFSVHLISELNDRSWMRLRDSLALFKHESVNMLQSFKTNEEVRKRHLAMFLDGYSDFLTCKHVMQDYLLNMNEMILGMSHHFGEGFEFLDDTLKCLAGLLKLKASTEHHEFACNELFKQSNADDDVEDKLVITFNSGVIFEVILGHGIDDDNVSQVSDIKAICTNSKTGQTCQVKLDIAYRNETNGRWVVVNHDKWLDKLINKAKKMLGNKYILGDVTNIICRSNCQFVWRMAYMEYDVLPKIIDMMACA